jgi:hypothetical protein
MTSAQKSTKENNKNLLNPDFANNELEVELEEYTRSAIRKIQFTVILKPAIISFVALIISFF